MPLFPTLLVTLGWTLAVWAWLSADGLPFTRSERWLPAGLSGEARRSVDIALSLLVMALGAAAAVA